MTNFPKISVTSVRLLVSWFLCLKQPIVTALNCCNTTLRIFVYLPKAYLNKAYYRFNKET